MNIRLTDLLSEQTGRRVTISGISFMVRGHENRLYMIPETDSDLGMIDQQGGVQAFSQTEVLPLLESTTGIRWQYDSGNPTKNLVFEVDFDFIVSKIAKTGK